MANKIREDLIAGEWPIALGKDGKNPAQGLSFSRIVMLGKEPPRLCEWIAGFARRGGAASELAMELRGVHVRKS